MELNDVMRTTFSARDYTGEELPDALIYDLIENARFAPSGGNRQGNRVVVVRDQGSRDTLSKLAEPAAKRYVAQIKAGESPWNAWTPTAVSAAGGGIRFQDAIDGVDLEPFLSGDEAGVPHDRLFWRRSVASAMREGDWKLIKVKGNPILLFNLADDPHEDHNLAAREPQRVDQMVALLRQQVSSGRSTPGPDINNERSRININQRLPNFVRKLLK